VPSLWFCTTIHLGLESKLSFNTHQLLHIWVPYNLSREKGLDMSSGQTPFFMMKNKVTAHVGNMLWIYTSGIVCVHPSLQQWNPTGDNYNPPLSQICQTAGKNSPAYLQWHRIGRLKLYQLKTHLKINKNWMGLDWVVYFQFLEAGEKHDNFLVVDAMVK
jgi:hypothetical protein